MVTLIPIPEPPPTHVPHVPTDQHTLFPDEQKSLQETKVFIAQQHKDYTRRMRLYGQEYEAWKKRQQERTEEVEQMYHALHTNHIRKDMHNDLSPENTRPIAEQLVALKQLLATPRPLAKEQETMILLDRIITYLKRNDKTAIDVDELMDIFLHVVGKTQGFPYPTNLHSSTYDEE